MTEDATAPTATDNRAAGRLELTLDGHLAELQYHEDDGGRLVLDHTEVPEELGGRGLGGVLVRAALARAAADGLTIVPNCPFARGWLEKHPDESESASIAW